MPVIPPPSAEEKAALRGLWKESVPALIDVQPPEWRNAALKHLQNHLFGLLSDQRIEAMDQPIALGSLPRALVVKVRISEKKDESIEARLDLSITESQQGSARLALQETCMGKCPIPPTKTEEAKEAARQNALEYSIREAIKEGGIMDSLVRYSTYKPASPPPAPGRQRIILTLQTDGLDESEVLALKSGIQRDMDAQFQATLDAEGFADSESCRKALYELRRRLCSDEDSARKAAASEWMRFMVPIACCRVWCHKTKAGFAVQLSLEDLTLFDEAWRPLVYQETIVGKDLGPVTDEAVRQMLGSAYVQKYVRSADAAVGVLREELPNAPEQEALSGVIGEARN